LDFKHYFEGGVAAVKELIIPQQMNNFAIRLVAVTLHKFVVEQVILAFTDAIV
jgi:hypothetical protein